MKLLRLFLLVVFIAILWPVQAQASQVLFEHREQTYLSRDVVFESIRQVTTAGFLDIHVLTIPLNDPYITVSPVESRRELGLRETALNLLTEAGAIGGVNADFFGLRGTHSLAFGPVVVDGQLLSITEEYNQGLNEFATFLIDENNIPMIRYITPRIWFTVNGVELLNVASINKVASFNRPAIINRQGMFETSQLSERYPYLFKVVVENGVITRVVTEPVIVPEDGFVVVMNADYFIRHTPTFWIGMPAQYDVFSNLERNFSQLHMAIGGGNLILQNGQVIPGSSAATRGRAPRTVLGVSSDWQRLILMTVDGRGHSIGATHDDVAALMLRFGAFDAMHFDGGGSTTMVAQTDGQGSTLEVVNRVSEGSQRRIVNALGVFDLSVPGAAYQLALMPYNRYIPLGGALHLHAYGLDLYRHRIALNPETVEFSVYSVNADGQRQPAGGTWVGNTYIPDQPGSLYVSVQYGELSASKTYFVQDIVALQFQRGPILTTMEAAIPFGVNGATVSGAIAALDPDRGDIHISVTPPELGEVINNVFTPSQIGIGYITVTMGNIASHLPVIVANDDSEAHAMYLESRETLALPSQAFADPIRTTITAASSADAFAFGISLPGEGSLAYASRHEGPVAVLQISAAAGGIFATDRSQWGRFLPDIEQMFPDYIIIRMDANPLRALSRDEFELFHQALRTQQAMGRTVFVLSNAEEASTFTLRDGIRYIDLGNAGEDSVVSFKITDQQIWYDF